ncbi:MAG: recombinase family protein [Aminipila sp.]
MDALYARQSVDKVDSISIETQLEYCRHESRNPEFLEYIDRGYSGKNTERPDFKRLMQDIETGKVKRVIVYKLDRISRSLLDFAGMMEIFQKFNVEFVSYTEKFDTSTPVGRAMLNICVVFAQLERETIQARVADAYSARSKMGLFMGGRIAYGFVLKPAVINGIHTSMYEEEEIEAEHIKLIFSLYAQPQNSFGDVVRFLVENNIKNNRGKKWDRARISEMIRNPVYVQSDLELYEFFKSQGTVLVNNPENFTGGNGCFLYRGQGEKESKSKSLKGHTIVVAPHKGYIPSDIWIKCRKKCLKNTQAAKPIKASNTWLAGKIKCGNCGYALTVRKAKTKAGRYFVCHHREQSAGAGCKGSGTIYADKMEEFISKVIKKELKELGPLSKEAKYEENPKLRKLEIEVKQIEKEIDNLISKISEADKIVMAYINKKVSELDSYKKMRLNEIQEIKSSNHLQQISSIDNCVDTWDRIEFKDKMMVLDTLIEKITATSKRIDIRWKI